MGTCRWVLVCTCNMNITPFDTSLSFFYFITLNLLISFLLHVMMIAMFMWCKFTTHLQLRVIHTNTKHTNNNPLERSGIPPTIPHHTIGSSLQNQRITPPKNRHIQRINHPRIHTPPFRCITSRRRGHCQQYTIGGMFHIERIGRSELGVYTHG